VRRLALAKRDGGLAVFLLGTNGWPVGQHLRGVGVPFDAVAGGAIVVAAVGSAPHAAGMPFVIGGFSADQVQRSIRNEPFLFLVGKQFYGVFSDPIVRGIGRVRAFGHGIRSGIGRLTVVLRVRRCNEQHGDGCGYKQSFHSSPPTNALTRTRAAVTAFESALWEPARYVFPKPKNVRVNVRGSRHGAPDGRDVLHPSPSDRFVGSSSDIPQRSAQTESPLGSEGPFVTRMDDGVRYSLDSSRTRDILQNSEARLEVLRVSVHCDRRRRDTARRHPRKAPVHRFAFAGIATCRQSAHAAPPAISGTPKSSGNTSPAGWGRPTEDCRVCAERQQTDTRSWALLSTASGNGVSDTESSG
jgi:hypothetical protein